MPSSRGLSGTRSGREASTHERRQSSVSTYSSRSSTSKKATSRWQSGNRQKRHGTASLTPLSRPASILGPVTPQPVNQRIWPESNDADEVQEHVIMAVDVKEKGKVGCAYYISREERLLCIEDSPKTGFEMIERLKFEIQPTTVLLSTRADALLDQQDGHRCRRQNSLLNSDEDNCPLPYETEVRPAPEFGYEGALTRLANLDSLTSAPAVRFLVPSDTIEDDFNAEEVGLTHRHGRLLHVATWLDLDSKVSVSCAGAIICHLQRKRASDFLRDDPEAQLAYRITSMAMSTCNDTMFINADTLTALQIIQPEAHPNASNQGPGTSGSKESLSVFGLFQHNARTPQGKARLRQLFFRPLLDLAEINMRLDFSALFSRPDNQPILRKLGKSFSKIKNMRNVMTMLHKGVEGDSGKFGSFKSGVWSSLLEFCYHAIDVVEGVGEVFGSEQLPLCAQAVDVLDRFQLQRIGKMVHDVVDLENSIEQHRTVVKRGMHNDLDIIKDAYDGMDEMLSQIAMDIARATPPEIDTPINVVYFPQLGYHITVPLDEATGAAMWSGENNEWERMFATNMQVYFKNAHMRQMDEQLGDLWAHICDAEIEISHDLAQRVLEDERLLVAASDVCGELDSLSALAHAVIEHKLIRPKFVNDNIISITAGRHILQEMTVPSFVPNDANMVGGDADEEGDPNRSKASMTMLTGPNYSGKSVYLKQIALIVYMAQVGCFVPADSCTLGLTDKMLTRINTKETVSKAQSAFVIDLQQIAIALSSCTPRSLVVIDEFGKGTDSFDGAGLAAGVFYHLLTLGVARPKVLAATHFHEIFDLGLFNDIPYIDSAHMQVRVNEKDERRESDHSSEVTYSYELHEGLSSLSYGAQCAAMNGIPSSIVARARQIADLMVHGEDVVACTALSTADEEDLVEADMVARGFLALDLSAPGSGDVTMASLSGILTGFVVGSDKRMGSSSERLS